MYALTFPRPTVVHFYALVATAYSSHQARAHQACGGDNGNNLPRGFEDTHLTHARCVRVYLKDMITIRVAITKMTACT